jgi:hypothetical protein
MDYTHKAVSDFKSASIYGDNFTLLIDGDDISINTDSGTINVTIDPIDGSISVAETEKNHTPTQNAFEPGHVFTAEELPEDKQHLIGALYFANDDNGAMLIVSAEQFKGIQPWYELEQRVRNLNKTAGNNVRIGTSKDWNVLLASEFAEKAKLIQPHTSYIYYRYWEAENTSSKTQAPTRHPKDNGWSWGHRRDSRAGGRFFTNIDPAELSM